MTDLVERRCFHPISKLRAGPNAPDKWGGGGTSICECGKWRIHGLIFWNDEPMDEYFRAYPETFDAITTLTARLVGIASQLKVAESHTSTLESTIQTLRGALADLFGSAKNEMAARNLPLEWQDDSPMGRAERALSTPISQSLSAMEKVMEAAIPRQSVDTVPALWNGSHREAHAYSAGWNGCRDLALTLAQKDEHDARDGWPEKKDETQ